MPSRPKSSSGNQPGGARGFTLAEVMITVGIVGILSSIALPNYFRQTQRTHQAEANATMSQMLATVAAFFDEFGTLPEQWADLNTMTTLMTNQGPATTNDGNLTTAITLPGDRYQLVRKNNRGVENYFVFEATFTNSASADFNVIACVDLKTGASHQIIGRNGAVAETSSLTCLGSS